jgi:hypothetical protein
MVAPLVRVHPISFPYCSGLAFNIVVRYFYHTTSSRKRSSRSPYIQRSSWTIYHLTKDKYHYSID